MANKRLNPQQIEELQKMVVKGVYPDDIARHFNIAVSSIHNYKKRFKELGIKFPSIKGKKPPNAPRPEEFSIRKPEKKPDIIGVLDNSDTIDGKEFKFIINGISVIISSEAKSVNISNNCISIRF